jgi:bifunctional DNase/RNase
MVYRAWRAIAALLVLAGCSRSPSASDAPQAASETAPPLAVPKLEPAANAKVPEPKTPPDDIAEAEPSAAPNEPSNAKGSAKVPRGFVRVAVRGIAPTPQGNAVLLVDEVRGRAVPVFVGDSEALSIQLRLENRRYARPLTHDLLDAMLSKLGGRIDSVRVEKLENNVFFGIVVISEHGRRVELDARTSDAVALAVGCSAPIYVNERVLERAGVSLDDLDQPAEEPDFRAPGDRPEPITL